MMPAALLLDFGGVLVEGARPHDPAAPELVLRLYNEIGGVLTPAEISRDLIAGNEMCSAAREGLDELSHEQMWEFVTAGWPPRAREAVRVHATRLAYDWAVNPSWQVRPGIREALEAAELPMAVVSNTRCGAAHRDFLAREGLGGYFGAQIYSDEAGIRKPNPEMIWRAARELGVPAEQCWFVGDSYQRDVECARRASVAKAIVLRSRRTAREEPRPEPDHEFDDGFGLRDLLRGL
jgi:N-acetyl-D-muramate 6-phosphate phosphatase